jgi:protein O-mannosyl-transferase
MGIAVVATMTVLAFLPTVRNGFVNFDDDRVLLHNPYLRLSAGNTLSWIWSTTFLGHYQPLTWMSLWIDYAAAGMAPLAYHVDSLAWHTAAAVLVYAVLGNVLWHTEAGRTSNSTRRQLAAASGALFWSIHPLRVESVAWVAERRDPISIVFLLLALLAYLRAADADSAPRRSRRLRVVSCACLLLSLLAKAWGMTFFVTLIALDVFPLRRLPLAADAFTDRRYRQIWREKIPFVLIGVAGGATAWLAQRAQPDTMVTTAEWSWTDRLLQSTYGLSFYVAKTVWPAGLAAMYERPDHLPRGAASIFFVCLIVAAASVALLTWTARKQPALFVAAVAYAAIVAPVLGFAQSGPQLVADRYAYVASVPFSALVAGVLLRVPQRYFLRALALVLAGLLLLATATWKQTEVWRDSRSLWSHAIESGHAGYVAHLDYGQALRADGHVDAAIAEYQAALAIRPRAGNAWYNLANALKAAGRYDDAERAYLTAIDRLSWKVDAQVNLGNLYFSRRQLPAAVSLYRAATTTLAHVAPAEFSPEPFLYLGIALSDSGDAAGAHDALAVAAQYPATRARAEAELRRIAGR